MKYYLNIFLRNYYKKKPKQYSEFLLKLWQEKLKKRNKDHKYLILSSSDERDDL